ncbi:spore germination protein GerW family protein [Georgenia sp. SYP-B2076]|uniref:spore germination protein GerW family protein n=1 Tax=Georgenia sp. SYP-B2076 TaxID=2495881 RepID=UPI000F8D7BE2|nr:spore germination protein GerW family protein [Georgenia sp. SYP-B2076]
MNESVTGNVNLPTESAREALTVRRVFGEAYQHEGVLVIPVAKIMGGSGMGFGSGLTGEQRPGEPPRPEGRHGHHEAGEGSGGGGGFGVRARPVGVYVIREGKVHWQPAMDLNRIILGGQIVGAIAVVSLSWALRKRRRFGGR